MSQTMNWNIASSAGPVLRAASAACRCSVFFPEGIAGLIQEVRR
jgi:hypothetical protein